MRVTGSAPNSAASGLGPMARTRAPNLVRVNTTVSTATAAANTHTAFGTPSDAPPPSTRKNAWSAAGR